MARPPEAPGEKSRPSPQGRRPRFIGDILTLGLAVGLLVAVQLLPPDASLSELRKAGRITVCMPDSYPPLVVSNPEAPGFDVELVRAVAQRLGLSLSIRSNRAMAQDFNPRSWRITRAQCQLLAGGIVLTASTLSFLDGTPPYLSTGWAVVMPERLQSLRDQPVAFYGGVSGLDRIGLSRQLRSAGADLLIVDSIADMERALLSGTASAGVTDGLRARQLGAEHDWPVVWNSHADSIGFPIGIGLWKGDLTLKRAIVSILVQLESEGFIAALYDKYDIQPIEGVLGGV